MEPDLQLYSVRTDLALEAKEMAQGPQRLNPGVNEEVEESDGIKVTRLGVANAAGSQAIGRAIGNYVTLEVPALRNGDTGLQQKVAEVFAREFEDFLTRIGIGKDASVLIVGLGNWNVTPDSLGPLVVENALITRQFYELVPDQVSQATVR